MIMNYFRIRFTVAMWAEGLAFSRIGLTFGSSLGIQRTRNNSKEGFSATPQISDTGKRKIPHEHLSP
jgi:hypothetical protein